MPKNVAAGKGNHSLAPLSQGMSVCLLHTAEIRLPHLGTHLSAGEPAWEFTCLQTRTVRMPYRGSCCTSTRGFLWHLTAAPRSGAPPRQLLFRIDIQAQQGPDPAGQQFQATSASEAIIWSGTHPNTTDPAPKIMAVYILSH